MTTIVVAMFTAALTAGTPAIAANMVRFARNADAVDGKHAVPSTVPLEKRAGKLVATDATGHLPNDIITLAPDAALLDGLDSSAFARAGAPIGADQLVNGSITAAKLATGSVSSSNVVDGSLSSDDLGPASVTAGELAGNSVTGGSVQDHSLAAADVTAASGSFSFTVAQLAAGNCSIQLLKTGLSGIATGDDIVLAPQIGTLHVAWAHATGIDTIAFMVCNHSGTASPAPAVPGDPVSPLTFRYVAFRP